MGAPFITGLTKGLRLSTDGQFLSHKIDLFAAPNTDDAYGHAFCKCATFCSTIGHAKNNDAKINE